MVRSVPYIQEVTNLSRVITHYITTSLSSPLKCLIITNNIIIYDNNKNNEINNDDESTTTHNDNNNNNNDITTSDSSPALNIQVVPTGPFAIEEQDFA